MAGNETEPQQMQPMPLKRKPHRVWIRYRFLIATNIYPIRQSFDNNNNNNTFFLPMKYCVRWCKMNLRDKSNMQKLRALFEVR